MQLDDQVVVFLLNKCRILCQGFEDKGREHKNGVEILRHISFFMR